MSTLGQTVKLFKKATPFVKKAAKVFKKEWQGLLKTSKKVWNKLDFWWWRDVDSLNKLWWNKTNVSTLSVGDLDLIKKNKFTPVQYNDYVKRNMPNLWNQSLEDNLLLGFKSFVKWLDKEVQNVLSKHIKNKPGIWKLPDAAIQELKEKGLWDYWTSPWNQWDG